MLVVLREVRNCLNRFTTLTRHRSTILPHFDDWALLNKISTNHNLYKTVTYTWRHVLDKQGDLLLSFFFGAVRMVDFAKNLPGMHCGSYLTAHWIPVPLEHPAGQFLSGSDHPNSPTDDRTNLHQNIHSDCGTPNDTLASYLAPALPLLTP